MPDIILEQALYLRLAGESPRLQSRSPAFNAAWEAEVAQLLVDFGDRPPGISCSAAIFAQPLGQDQVAIVQVSDQPVQAGQPPLGFHVLVMSSAAYRHFLGDPFAVADRFPPPWHQWGAELPVLTMTDETPAQRTVAAVQQVLKRVKASALREDEDPAAIKLTEENAESPALLGGVQVLVDGGKVVFVRPLPDPGLIRGLWTLLPSPARCELWPATFAFSNTLGFDALVVPRLGGEDFSSYTTEEQAADYPAGRYELSLQAAAESGDQAELDALLTRRSSREMLRLAMLLVVAFSIAALVLRFVGPPSPPAPLSHELSPEQRERAATAAAMVASGDPWTAVALHEAGRYRRAERAATAAGIVAIGDPLAAAIQARSAHARYVEIWKKVE